MKTIKLMSEGQKVYWFPDSTSLITWDERILQLWNTEGEEISRIQFNRFLNIKRNPKYNVIACGGAVGKRRDFGTSRDYRNIGYIIDPRGSILSEIRQYFAWKPDGEYLATYVRDGKMIDIWHFADGRLTLSKSLETKKSVHLLDWGFDTDHVAIINEADNKGYVIDLEEGKNRESFKIKEHFNVIAWSPASNIIAGGSAGGEFKVWQIEIREKHKIKKHDLYKTDLKSPILRLEWLSPTIVMLYVSQAGVFFFDLANKTFSSFASSKVFAVSPDLKYLATEMNNVIRIFDIQAKQEAKKIAITGVVNDLDFSPNGEFLACVAGNCLLYIFQRNVDF